VCVMTQCWYAACNSFISDDAIIRERQKRAHTCRQRDNKKHAGNHVNTHARRPNTRELRTAHTHTHTLTNTQTHTHSLTHTPQPPRCSAECPRNATEWMYVASPWPKQASTLVLLAVRRRGRCRSLAWRGRWAEKVLRDGNRTKTAQHGCDRSRWCPAGRHKTIFLVFTKDGLLTRHTSSSKSMRQQQKRTLLSYAGPRTAAADKVGI
jgi:hypothetical protein